MKTWVKLYTEILDDPKVGTLPWSVRGVWMALLALAGKIDDRDGEGLETGRLDTLENIAWYLRISVPELQEAIIALQERGMVDERDGILYVTNYAKRQARSPSARPQATRERQCRHRGHKASEERHEDVTSASRGDNEDVTSASRGDNEDVTSASRGDNEPVTPLDTDTDTETDTETEKITTPPTSGGEAPETPPVEQNPPPEDPPPRHKRSPSEKDLKRGALEEHFAALTGLPKPKRNTAKQRREAGELWWGPLRDILELASWDLDTARGLVDAAVAHMAQENLTISAPKSIYKTALAIWAQRRRSPRIRAGPEPLGFAGVREFLAQQEASNGNP